jgi:hypothetical protein
MKVTKQTRVKDIQEELIDLRRDPTANARRIADLSIELSSISFLSDEEILEVEEGIESDYEMEFDPEPEPRHKVRVKAPKVDSKKLVARTGSYTTREVVQLFWLLILTVWQLINHIRLNDVGVAMDIVLTHLGL